MLAALCTTLLLAAGEASARWRVTPASVQVGEPFELLLELEHPSGTTLAELAPGELALGAGWLVLEREEPRSAARADGLASTLAWRVVALEPGERSLAEDLAGFVFGEAVARIRVGETTLRVTSALAEGEDAPRSMTGFAGELGPAPGARGGPWALLAGLALVLAAALLFLWRRARRARAVAAPEPDAAQRLAALQARAAAGEGREGCYGLTRLLREHTDRFRKKERAALTDEEWLAELAASLEVPAGALTELTGVFERAGRVKYAGEQPSPWALEETFARAQRALAALGPAGTEARA